MQINYKLNCNKMRIGVITIITAINRSVMRSDCAARDEEIGSSLVPIRGEDAPRISAMSDALRCGVWCSPARAGERRNLRLTLPRHDARPLLFARSGFECERRKWVCLGLGFRRSK